MKENKDDAMKSQANLDIEKTDSGLIVNRLYTTEGVHPYDEVSWERREVVQVNWKTNETVFSQRGVEFPDFWSLNASTIVTTKYFRGAMDTEEREWSLKQVIDRVVRQYVEAARNNGYMDNANAEIFEHELTWMLLHQVFSFNSPVWFNVGTSSPQFVSACFILAVDDTIDSILNWYREEGLIFKGGSGAGTNLSKLRSSKELLRRSGGSASGPVSFMRGADASAGAIKSGGACLAPWTLVYTESGPKTVKELAESLEDFITLSYNPILERVQATKARAWLSGKKKLVKLSTDKGEFTLSYDHPVMLLSGGYKAVGELTEGMSIRPGNISVNDLGYQRVGLHNGLKEKESVHRLIAQDILCIDIENLEVHHKDRNPRNNKVSNLTPLTRTEHNRLHAQEDLDSGIHPFLQFHGKGNHPAVSGDNNGMSRQSGNRTEAYAIARDKGMRANRVYELGQDAAARQRMLNIAYKIVNNTDHSIDTFDQYFQGRKALAGKMGYSKEKQLSKIVERFGSYESFLEEVRSNNHKVVAIEELEESLVYDVEVDNDTPRDKSHQDGHNFMIISETNNQKGYTGIFVSNTRRAAKMVVLDVDHPDIEEFIETKSREEKKIRALRDAGFDMDLDGKDISSVQFQNANNSVRVSDKFMKAVENGETFDLLARLDKRVIESVDAKKLWRKIATAAWECADPGIQYDDTINHWHTNPETGRINASNPCSEYVHLDNSSCNLASLNLMKFRKKDGTFDHEGFARAVELIITAMEISISFADFPTKAIAENTRNHRQLGIGYANLGALLMSTGVAYDSTQGRALAGSITSLMTAVSYRRSAEIAKVVGAYKGYIKNAVAHKNVMNMHKEATENLLKAISTEDGPFFIAEDIVSYHEAASKITRAAIKEWKYGITLGEVTGWRNAQTSVLAPTGTISFMMDCDTTGVEPDFSLAKFKKLVGGSSMKIINNQVDPALRSLGYHEETIEAIEAFVAEHGHIINAPGLKPEHYSVFDCAIGDRAISPNGHIRMMAAVQPFISGAISKTVNLPETATIEDIESVYFDGWKLGLKAIAVYRDNCKVGQPLSDGKAKKVTVAESNVIERIVERIIEKPARRRLPSKRSAEITSFTVSGAKGILTVGLYEDGKVGEVFIKMSKQGSTLAGIMDALSIAISMGLQYGVPLEAYVAKFTNMQFEPRGMTDDKDIRMAQSLLDYIFRRLALDYLSLEIRDGYKIFTTSERTTNLDQEIKSTLNASQPNNPQEEMEREVMVETEALIQAIAHKNEYGLDGVRSRLNDAPLCVLCGVQMVNTGACNACPTCGATTGCS